MKNFTKHRALRPIAAATAACLVLAPSLALAAEDEAPTAPLDTRESQNAVGQSVQIRANADGEPNSSALDFRWSVTQISAEGEADGELEVRVPEDGSLLHNLQQFGTIPQENGYGVYDIGLDGSGYGIARSVSLYPQDRQLPVEITTSFTLDGEPVTAGDLVGADGVVTAQYTVKNMTRQTMDVPVKGTLSGEEVVKSVPVDVPMVVEATTLLPTRFSALNTGSGLAGADGRGNWQVKWIGLPFSPLSKEGTTTFGWSANVRNGVVPAMRIQVLPMYIPEKTADTPVELDPAVKKKLLSLGTPPDVSGDVANIKAGLTDVIGGIQGLTSGNGDPLDALEGVANNFFQEFGQQIAEVSTLLDPNNPQGAVAKVAGLNGVLDKVNGALAKVQGADAVGVLAEQWPTISGVLATAKQALPLATNGLAVGDWSGLIDCSRNGDPGTYSASDFPLPYTKFNALMIAATPPEGNYKGWGGASKGSLPETGNQFGDMYLTSGGLFRWTDEDGGRWVTVGNGEVLLVPGGPTANGRALCERTVGTAANPGQLNNIVAAKYPDLDLPALTAELQQLGPKIDTVLSNPALTPDQAAQTQALLNEINGALKVLTPELQVVSGLTGGIEPLLTGLGAKTAVIAAGLQAKQVDLPALDQVLQGVIAKILATPEGQQITAGLQQTQTGVEGAKTQMAAYVGSIVVQLKAALDAAKDKAPEAKEKVAAAVDTADTLKAEIGGLMMAAHTSPLPYGGDPSTAPAGTELAGAYEFILDPANTEAPSTLPRLLLGILALLAGGFAANMLISRRSAAAATAGGAAAADAGSFDAGNPTTAMPPVDPDRPPTP